MNLENRMQKRTIATVAAIALSLSAVSFAQQRSPTALRSPWDGHPVALTNAPYACPALPHLSPDLTTDGFYADSKGSIVDPVKMKAYNESAGPYKELGNITVAAADAYRKTGSRAAAQCVRQLLNTAAKDRVFTGKMSSTQAYFVQGWTIGGLAIAYLKVRDSGVIPPAEAAADVAWMKQVARQTLDFYDGKTRFTGGWQNNNHRYWAGVEIAAVGVAADDRSMLDWAIAAYRTGIALIQPDGTSPEELRRGQRALHYHLYAAAPLVFIAEFAEDNGVDLYAERDHALSRLIKRSTDGLLDSSYFQQKTGIKQDLPDGPPSAEAIGWAVPYVKRFPDPTISALIAKATSLSYMYLGGLPPE